MTARLDAQVRFLTRADQLKSVERDNVLLDLSRHENTAEHSWHLSLWALVFAQYAGPDVSISRVIRMLVLHDLVEVVVGDHPIHHDTDWEAVAIAEEAAAQDIFAMLPADQGQNLLSLWYEFEADTSPDAQFAKMLDRTQPLFQVLSSPSPRKDHLEVVRYALKSGRSAYLHTAFPEAFDMAKAMLDGTAYDADTDFAKRICFAAEADKLKLVNRATTLIDGSRRENSAEHSWHQTLLALVLEEYAHTSVDPDLVIKMLILHDIVEIDAGDNPIFATPTSDVAADESAAADRIFGLLPQDQGFDIRSIWEEFEAAETPSAQFAKALDRFQPPLQNLASGGGTWIEYRVDISMVEQRVAPTILRGAPDLWAYIGPKIHQFFEENLLPMPEEDTPDI